jgi:hypothetical protein
MLLSERWREQTRHRDEIEHGMCRFINHSTL